jgi:hypothetical protein
MLPAHSSCCQLTLSSVPCSPFLLSAHSSRCQLTPPAVF